MPSCLTRHHIFEWYLAHPFLHYISICWLCLYIKLLFLWISHLGGRWKKSGVKTRPSEQTVLPVEEDLLLGLDSSSEMDSETDGQSYSPTEVYALTWHGYTAHIMHMVSCIAWFRHRIHNIQHHVLSSDIISNALCLAYKSHMWIKWCNPDYLDNM